MPVLSAYHLSTATGYARVWAGGAVGYDVRRLTAAGGNTSHRRRRNHAARDNEEVSIRVLGAFFALFVFIFMV